MTSATPPTRARHVHYPEKDGKPFESDLHRDLMNDLIFALKLFLKNRRAYVAGNLFIYFEEGNPKAVVAPDVFVISGVQQRRRRTYRAWEEGMRLPDVVIELTSKKTHVADQSTKPELYARLGVRELFLFDPFGDYLRPRLQGHRLVGGIYQPIEEYPLRSTALGLVLREEDNALRLYNPRTGERLRTAEEAELARLAAEAARNATMDQLEAEAMARLEAETRAEEQTARAEQAARAAEEQTARAEAAEAELARLRALLEQREG